MNYIETIIPRSRLTCQRETCVSAVVFSMHDSSRSAAQPLTRLDPQEESSWGYLGEALTRSGDRAGARRAATLLRT
jgi:DNA-binding SARP family transcriptional activator